MDKYTLNDEGISLQKALAESIDQNIVDESFLKNDKEIFDGLKKCSNTPMSLIKFLCDWRYYILKVENRVEQCEKELNDFIIKVNEMGEVYHKDFNDRIKKLENQIKEINGQKFSEFHYLIPRIERLEKINLDGDKLHKEWWDRIEKIENSINMEDRITVSDVLLRLTKLEYFEKEVSDWMLDKQENLKYLEGNQDELYAIVKTSRGSTDIAMENYMRQFDRRISKIEKTQSELIDKIAEIANFYYQEKKTPHKCPVCDGARFNKPELKTIDASISIDGVECEAGKTIYWKSMCAVCEGKGVLWG